MKKEVHKNTLANAEQLMAYSDKEILALYYHNIEKEENAFKMVMNIRLKNTLNSLKRSITVSSWVMGIMTLILVVLTFALFWMARSSAT